MATQERTLNVPAVFVFTPAELARLRFVRWLVEQGRLSEEV